MFKRIYFGVCLLLFFVFIYFVFITFKPITKVTSEDITEVKGKVDTVYAGSGGDIYVQLYNDKHEYYINRATYLGYNVETLEDLILNQEVKLCHIKRWTPLTRDKVLPHISRLTLKDSIIFDEIIEVDGKK